MKEDGKQTPQKRNEHPFDRLMFGTKHSPSISVENTDKKPTSDVKEETFDMVSMMQNVDQLMSSVSKLKPMAKQLMPLLDIFKSKK